MRHFKRKHMNRHFSSRSILTAAVAITALAAISGCQSSKPQPDAIALNKSAAPLMAYVGTFSSPLKDMLPTQVDLPPGNGRGIHIFRADRNTGALQPLDVFELGTSPSCLVVNAAKTRLYSANETDRVGEKKEGTVSAFAIDSATGRLTLLNTVRSGGAGPTYISLHPRGKFLFVANYFGGCVAVLPISEDGRLGDPADIKEDSGEIGPRKSKASFAAVRTVGFESFR